jgi:hypothetical protein
MRLRNCSPRFRDFFEAYDPQFLALSDQFVNAGSRSERPLNQASAAASEKPLRNQPRGTTRNRSR